MDRRTLMLGLAVAAAAPGAALAADKPPVKLAKVFPFLDKYLALPPNERNRFTLGYMMRVDGKPAAGLKAAIVEADGRRTPLSFGPDGRVQRLPTAVQLATASFVAEVPADAKMGVNLNIEPLLALTQEVNPREVEASIAQANAGIAKSAGLMGFAVPKMTGVIFVGAGSGKARLAGGREAALPLDEKGPFYNPKTTPGAQTLLLGKAPSRVSFKDK